jgi:hypothetical protein
MAHKHRTHFFMPPLTWTLTLFDRVLTMDLRVKHHLQTIAAYALTIARPPETEPWTLEYKAISSWFYATFLEVVLGIHVETTVWAAV